MIVGLNGYARSGKDEAARALVEKGYERRAFADAVRNVLYATNPIVRVGGIEVHQRQEPIPVSIRLRPIVDEFGWEYAKNEFTEVRELLQRLGTEGGRDVLGTNVWVDASLRNLPEKVVVTDVRFPNEADAIKSAGGVVVRIVRDGVGPVNTHVSDNAMNDYEFDVTISNNGTIEQLHNKMITLVEELR